jgi:hypothetical protein
VWLLLQLKEPQTMAEHQAPKEIFLEAIDLPEERRAAYLERACDDDAALREEVETLLEAHRQAGSFLGVNRPDSPPDAGP